MHRRSVIPAIVAVSVMVAGVLETGDALAQPVNRQASNITPYDTRSVIAPALPVPPVPSAGPPSLFLTAARRALAVGRTGEAQEALERAETRLLDQTRSTPGASVPGAQQAVLAIAAARQALAAHDRQAAIAAIDDALADADRDQPHVATAAPSPITTAPSAPAASLPPPVPLPDPVITRALLPGHWALHGARYVWVPPETQMRPVEPAALVAGAYVWRNGAYVWVPMHDTN